MAYRGRRPRPNNRHNKIWRKVDSSVVINQEDHQQQNGSDDMQAILAQFASNIAEMERENIGLV